jgi:hypothetical protein
MAADIKILRSNYSSYDQDISKIEEEAKHLLKKGYRPLGGLAQVHKYVTLVMLKEDTEECL